MKKTIVFAAAAALVLLITSCTCLAGNHVPGEYGTDVSAEAISLSNTYFNICVGDTVVISAVLRPQKTSDEVSFTSDNEKVASVNEQGEITALSPGEATVYAKSGPLSASCRVTVQSPQAERIYADVTVLNLKVGESCPLNVSVYPADAVYEDIVYFSDDERIATVDDDGTVTAVGAGLTSVGMYVKGAPRVRFIVEVNTSCDSISKMEFSEFYYPVLKDGVTALELIIEPFGMSADKIVYTSSDESIVTVDANGAARGMQKGMAIVTAEAPDGVSAQCFVAVTDRLPLEPVSHAAEPRYEKNGDGIYSRQYNSDEQDALLMLAGGIAAGEAQQNSARGGGSYDFSESFEYLRKAFASGDFSMAALYSTLSYSYPYACEEGGSRINAPSTLLDAVRYAGIDAVSAASEYSLETGKQGLFETVQQLKNYGIANTGAYTEENESRGMLVDINGIRVGILSYTDSLGDTAGRMSASERTSLVSVYSEKQVIRDVADLKEGGAEFIIAYINWGGQEGVEVTERQKTCVKNMAEAGVDLITGTSPDGLQEAEFIRTKDGRNVLAVYSLGNLVSSEHGTADNDAVILCVSIGKQGGEAALKSASYIPLRLIGSYNGGSYVTVPAVPSLNGENMTLSLELARERIAQLFKGVLSEAVL